MNSEFDKFGTLKFYQPLLLGLFLAATLVSPAQARTDLPVYNPRTGKLLFMYRIYNQGEVYLGSQGSETSTFTLSNAEKQALVRAGNYWAEILASSAKNSHPLYFTVGTLNEKNADAKSFVVEAGPWTGMTELAAGLIGNAQEAQWANDPPAHIRIGNQGDWARLNPAQLSESGDKWPLTEVMVHEIGHALGVTSNSGYDGSGKFLFDPVLSKFDEHLYDQKGNRATAGAKIITSAGDRTSPADFLVEPFSGSLVGGDAEGGLLYFSGAHVQDVLQGALLTNPRDPTKTALPGIPINGWEYDSGQTPPAFFDGNHIELSNSMMSHQDYRSYMTFMEAELAILQDIGYTIGRKNFFGYSEYRDGQTLTNTQGYFVRNADGTVYLPGVANTASFGVGLHIYGSNNDITQVADLLSNGVAGG